MHLKRISSKEAKEVFITTKTQTQGTMVHPHRWRMMTNCLSQVQTHGLGTGSETMLNVDNQYILKTLQLGKGRYIYLTKMT